LHGLKSQRSGGSQLDEEEEDDEDEEEEDEDEEDHPNKFLPSKKTILKNVSVSLLVYAIVLLIVNRKNLRRHRYHSHRRRR
jgi:hypothetical protein